MGTKYLYGDQEATNFTVQDEPAHAGHKPIKPELTDDELRYIERVTAEYERMQEWLRKKEEVSQ